MESTTTRLCFYCGKPAKKVRKGEHLIPEAIGGTRTTKYVCRACNGDFSEIDRELCSHSLLSIVALTESFGKVKETWDCDVSYHNLLLEGRPDLVRGSFRLYPQMIITPHGEQLRGDWEELQKFGPEKFFILFRRRIRKTFWEYENTDKKSLFFHKVQFNDDIFQTYLHLPRFYVRGSVDEACSDKTIEFSYLGENAKRMALSRLEAGLRIDPVVRSEAALGSQRPTVRHIFDMVKVWRALAKISVNLLHEYCDRTVVDHNTFTHVIEQIRGIQQVQPKKLAENGFVWHQDVKQISTPNSHSFRFRWIRGVWHVEIVFFGGRMGAFVTFPGPSNETWSVLDITAPVDSRDWAITKSSFPIPSPTLHIEWGDGSLIIADLDLDNAQSATFVEWNEGPPKNTRQSKEQKRDSR